MRGVNLGIASHVSKTTRTAIPGNRRAHSASRRRRPLAFWASGGHEGPTSLPGARMPIKTELDSIDWRILRELQQDGRITNVELSKRVGISAPPCLRRVKRLEQAGLIRGYRALLDGPALGRDVVAFCLVGLRHQAEADLKGFEELTRGWPMVRQAWMVSGESDFLLHCVAPDLATFQSFVIEVLTSAPNVETVRSALTIRQVKDEGPVDI